MIKWLWYVNGGLAVASLIVLVTGLVLLPELHADATAAAGTADAGSGSSAEQAGGAGQAGMKDSPLVAVARAYVKRWEPKPRPKPSVKPKPVTKPKPVPKPKPPEKGALTVTIAPAEVVTAGAQWQSAGGAWHDSGAATELIVGSHKVRFKAVKGWVKPAEITVDIAKDRPGVGSTTYMREKPPPPGFVLDGTLMIGSDYGLAWIKLPKAEVPQLCAMGETIENYKITLVADGSITLNRDGFDYKLEVPKPKPPQDVKAAKPSTKLPKRKPKASRKPKKPHSSKRNVGRP